MNTLKILTLTLLFVVHSNSLANCYQIYNAQEKIIYESMEPPIDMSVSYISLEIEQRFPGSRLLITPSECARYITPDMVLEEESNSSDTTNEVAKSQDSYEDSETGGSQSSLAYKKFQAEQQARKAQLALEAKQAREAEKARKAQLALEAKQSKEAEEKAQLALVAKQAKEAEEKAQLALVAKQAKEAEEKTQLALVAKQAKEAEEKAQLALVAKQAKEAEEKARETKNASLNASNQTTSNTGNQTPLPTSNSLWNMNDWLFIGIAAMLGLGVIGTMLIFINNMLTVPLLCYFGLHKWYKSPEGMLCVYCGKRMQVKSSVSSSKASYLTAPVKMPAPPRSRSTSLQPAPVARPSLSPQPAAKPKPQLRQTPEKSSNITNAVPVILDINTQNAMTICPSCNSQFEALRHSCPKCRCETMALTGHILNRKIDASKYVDESVELLNQGLFSDAETKNRKNKMSSEEQKQLAYSLAELRDNRSTTSIPRLIEGAKDLMDSDHFGEYLGIVVAALVCIPGGLAKLKSVITSLEYDKSIIALKDHVHKIEGYVVSGFGSVDRLNDLKQAIKSLGLDIGERKPSGKKCQRCGKMVPIITNYYDRYTGTEKQLCQDCVMLEMNG